MTIDLDLRKKVTRERSERFRKVLEQLQSRISRGEHNDFLAIEVAATESELTRLLEELSSLESNSPEVERNQTQHQNPQKSTLGNVMAIAEDLGILSGDSVPTWDVASVFPQLTSQGMNREFLENRLLISGQHYGIQDPKLNQDLDIAALKRVLGLDEEQWPGAIINQGTDLLSNMRVQLKAPRSANIESVRLYSRYVDYLVHVIAQAMSQDNHKDLFGMTAEKMRQQIMSQYGAISLSSTLKYAWNHGIPVVPLNDLGRFDGALWRQEKQPVVVLNLRDQSESRWLSLLLHELAHITQEDNDDNTAILEENGFIRNWNESEAEHEARWFALDVALGNEAATLTDRIVEKARGNVPRLKNATIDVARSEGVDLGILADFLAYQLSRSAVQWWGTATNLQPKGTNPLSIARSAFHEHFDSSKLSAFDSLLLDKAITQGDA